MKEIIAGMIMLWRKQQSVSSNISQIVCKSPGYLVFAFLSNIGSTARKITIYDGESSNEPVLFPMQSVGKGNASFCPALPLPFNRGLYIEVESDSCYYTLGFVAKRE